MHSRTSHDLAQFIYCLSVLSGLELSLVQVGKLMFSFLVIPIQYCYYLS